jgi:hypothetical protein
MRKTAAKLAKLPPLPDDPIERTETLYRRAATELEAAWKDNDALWSGKTASGLRKGVTTEQWDASLARVAKAQHKMFQAWDTWKRTERQALEKKFAPIEDLRVLVTDAIKPNLDGIQFNINYGMLASKVAQQIHHDSIEETVGDPPLCEACA